MAHNQHKNNQAKAVVRPVTQTVMCVGIDPNRVDIPMYIPSDNVIVDYTPNVVFFHVLGYLMRNKWCVVNCDGSMLNEPKQIENFIVAGKPAVIQFASGYYISVPMTLQRATVDIMPLYDIIQPPFTDLPIILQAYHYCSSFNDSNYDFEAVHGECYTAYRKSIAV